MNLTLFEMYWRRTLKRPGAILLWASLPFVFMTIYTLAFGSSGRISPATLLLVDEDGTLVSGFVKNALTYDGLSEVVSVKEIEDIEQAERIFAKNQASAVLVIPKGFARSLLLQEKTDLELYTNPRHHINPAILEGVMESLVTLGNGLLGVFSRPLGRIGEFARSDTEPDEEDLAEISKLFYAAGRNAESISSLGSMNVRVVEKEGGSPAQSNFAAYFFPGLVAFSLFTLSLSLEARFLSDRLKKLNRRLASAPVSPALVIVNQRLYSITFLYFTSVVISLLGGLVWRIEPVGIIEANLIMLLLIITIVGVNSTIFSLAASAKGGGAIASFVMVILVMIGGSIMPVEIYPESIKRIAYLTPTGIANAGIVESITGREISVSIPLLASYGALLLAASIVSGRRRLIA